MRRPTMFDLVFMILGVGLALLIGIGAPLVMFP
jgi:hypothetical protein